MYSLITNSLDNNILEEITTSLESCNKFYFNVAFVNYSGLQLLLDSFNISKLKGIQGKIITGTYLNFTEPKALSKLLEFDNISSRLYFASKNIGFHPKAYIFEYDDEYKVIVGSSNITRSALKSNVEWNMRIITKKEDYIDRVENTFEKVWEESQILDKEIIENYEISKLKSDLMLQKINVFNKSDKIIPNYMQNKALDALKDLRNKKQSKALIVSATGTGKTYSALFDVKNYNPKKILFLAHQENILYNAKQTFEENINNKNIKFAIYSGTSKDRDADYLFATIQSMNNRLNDFDSKEFEYIIVDEAHHSASSSYRKVLNYFKPKFLLGMTATPERGDGVNIYELFDNNLAIDIRLREAMENDMLSSFHYFGITDIDEIDLSNMENLSLEELANKLSINKRVDLIVEKMDFYGYSGSKMKCLGFCATIEHAKYMEKEFNKRGIKSIALTSEHKPDIRAEEIKYLEDDKNELKVIFTVDIFNEGIDIPSVNMVLMLRPTNSPIIFIQQLGRGLRKNNEKEFLTVLDFIGNYNRSFLMAIALSGNRFYDKDSLGVLVRTDFKSLPNCNITLDKISKNRILSQIEKEDFYSLKNLKKDYESFKVINKNEIPFYLMDYYNFEVAPDPIKFILKEKNYIKFLSKVEKNNEKILKLLSDDMFARIISQLSSELPIKRIHEFAIINYLIENDRLNLEVAQKEILHYTEKVDKETVLAAFRNLNFEFSDKGEITNNIQLIEKNENILKKSEIFINYLKNEEYKKIIKDILNYGIIRYEKEFGRTYYGVPHFKLYSEYNQRDMALLSNYDKTHSSYRGSGVLTNKELNSHFFCVDLHKDSGIDERINYKDKLISRKQFQWESPNNTKVSSERGQDFINASERGVTLHLFVRKFKKIDNVVSKYIYLGKIIPIKGAYRNEQPIEIQYLLEHEIPEELYIEFEPNIKSD